MSVGGQTRSGQERDRERDLSLSLALSLFLSLPVSVPTAYFSSFTIPQLASHPAKQAVLLRSTHT